MAFAKLKKKKIPRRIKGKQRYKNAASIRKCSRAQDQAHLCSAEQLDGTGATEEGIPPPVIVHKAVPKEGGLIAAAAQCESPAVPLQQRHTKSGKDSSVTVPEQVRGDHWVHPSPGIVDSDSGLCLSRAQAWDATLVVWVLPSVGDIMQTSPPRSLLKSGFCLQEPVGLCSLCSVTVVQQRARCLESRVGFTNRKACLESQVHGESDCMWPRRLVSFCAFSLYRARIHASRSWFCSWVSFVRLSSTFCCDESSYCSILTSFALLCLAVFWEGGPRFLPWPGQTSQISTTTEKNIWMCPDEQRKCKVKADG